MFYFISGYRPKNSSRDDYENMSYKSCSMEVAKWHLEGMILDVLIPVKELGQENYGNVYGEKYKQTLLITKEELLRWLDFMRELGIESTYEGLVFHRIGSNMVGKLYHRVFIPGSAHITKVNTLVVVTILRYIMARYYGYRDIYDITIDIWNRYPEIDKMSAFALAHKTHHGAVTLKRILEKFYYKSNYYDGNGFFVYAVPFIANTEYIKNGITRSPVTVHGLSSTWSKNQVPYNQAKTDTELLKKGFKNIEDLTDFYVNYYLTEKSNYEKKSR